MKVAIIMLLFALTLTGDAKEDFFRAFDLNARMKSEIRMQREAREKAEREAREKAEREAREKAEREAREKAEREAREKALQEQLEKAERDALMNEWIIGTWQSEPLDVSDMVSEGMKSAGAIEPYLEFEQSRLTVRVLFMVTQDGRANVTMDHGSYLQLMDYIKEQATAAAIRYFESGISKWGIKVSLESYLKMLGIDLEKYVSDIIGAGSQDFQPDDMSYECYLQVLDGRLYVAAVREKLPESDTYYDFDLTEDDLVLKQYYVNGKENDRPLGQKVKLPISFSRVK